MKQEIYTIDDMEIDILVIILNEGKKDKNIVFHEEVREEAMLIASTLKGALRYARLHGCTVSNIIQK